LLVEVSVQYGARRYQAWGRGAVSEQVERHKGVVEVIDGEFVERVQQRLSSVEGFEYVVTYHLNRGWMFRLPSCDGKDHWFPVHVLPKILEPPFWKTVNLVLEEMWREQRGSY